MKNLILVLLTAVNLNIFAQWVKQNPVTNLRPIYGIDFTDINTGWAVGDSGTVIRTTNGGANWENRNFNTTLNLKSISFINLNVGYICCDSGRVYKTINAGTSWFLLNTGTNQKMYAMYFINENTGLIGGGSVILRTTDGGINWTFQHNNSQDYITDMMFINQQTGWANVYSGNLLKTTNGGVNWFNSGYSPTENVYFVNENTGWGYSKYTYFEVFYKTTNGGQNWISHTIGSMRVYSMLFADQNTGWAAGYNGIAKTTNQGLNWSHTEANSSVLIRCLTAPNPQTLYGSSITAEVIKTTNSGTNWFVASNDIIKSLHNVEFFNDNTGYLIGICGTFAKTTNGGMNWIKKNMNTISDFYNFYFLNISTGWTITGTNPPKLYRTTNGGESWQANQMNVSLWIYSLYFANQNTGWITGDSGRVFKTTDGGASWFRQWINTLANIWDIKGFNENIVIMATPDSGIFRSTNGGTNWMNTGSLYGLRRFQIINQNTAYGWNYLDTIIKTTNAGLTWQGFWGFRFGMEQIQFLNENTGFVIEYNQISKTLDGGHTWSYPVDIPGAWLLYDLYFVNINTGWVVGEAGQIYKTTNGNTIGITPISNEIPESFSLSQNYPNPFNPSTIIEFQIPKSEYVKLIIYDITGKEVEILVNAQLQSGTYKVSWDGSRHSSGIYIYTLKTDNFSKTKKMVLLK